MRKLMTLLLVALVSSGLTIAAPRVAVAAPTDLDPTFGDNGSVVRGPPSFTEVVEGLAIDSQGRYLAAGTVDGQYFGVFRLTTAGAQDNGFASGSTLSAAVEGTSEARSLVVQTDDKPIIVGAAASFTKFAAVRFLADGSNLDSTWGTVGKAFASFGGSAIAEDAALQSDGKAVLAGFADTGTSDGRDFALARFTTGGVLDTDFDGDGLVRTEIVNDANDTIEAVAIQPDGKIVVGGSTSISPSRSAVALARYNSNGSLDTSFSDDGKLTVPFGAAFNSSFGEDLAIQPDGSIVISGFVDTRTSSEDTISYAMAVARILPNGTPDPSFGDGGKTTVDIGSTTNEYARGVALQPDGKIVLSADSQGGALVARLKPNGDRDATFAPGGVKQPGFAGSGFTEVLAQSDGKIVQAGAQNNNFALLRYLGGDLPEVSVDDPVVTEGGTATFTLTASAPADGDIDVSFNTTDGTAGPDDYAPAEGGTATIPDGETTTTVEILTTHDTLDEPDETFSLTIEDPTPNAALGDATGVATITDDDAGPAMSVANSSVSEGNRGLRPMVFTVQLNAVSGQTVSAKFRTVHGTAKAADYVAQVGTLSFAPGETSKTVTVQVKGDRIDEPNERFQLKLTASTNASIARAVATGTILDND